MLMTGPPAMSDVAFALSVEAAVQALWPFLIVVAVVAVGLVSGD